MKRLLALVAVGLILLMFGFPVIRAAEGPGQPASFVPGFVLPLIALGTFIGLLAVGSMILDRVLVRLDAIKQRRAAQRRWWPRARRGWLFVPLFTVWLLAVVAWLVAGLVPLLIREAPAWHAALHRAGGTTRAVRLIATGGQFSTPEVTLRSAAATTLHFANQDDIYHNVSIYEPGAKVLFRAPPVRARYAIVQSSDSPTGSHRELQGAYVRHTVRIDEPGRYAFRCDIHPKTMRGSVEVVPPGTGPDHLAAFDAVAWYVPHEHVWDERARDAVPRSLFRDPYDPGWYLTDLARSLAEAAHSTEPGWQVFLDYLFSFFNLALAVFLVRRRPHERIARLFGVSLVAVAGAYNLHAHLARLLAPFFNDAVHGLLHVLASLPFVFALLLFPDGRLVPRWNRRWMRIWWGFVSLFAVMVLSGASGAVDPRPGLGHAANYLVFFGAVIPAVGLLAQHYRVRRSEDEQVRAQARLLRRALLPLLAVGLLLALVAGLRGPESYAEGYAAVPRLVFRISQPLLTIIPVALFIGILRYRWWGIQLVVNKAIVFSALAAFIGGVYVAVVIGLGETLERLAVRGGEDSVTALSVIATVIVAVAFQPARERLRRFADRLVYGERASAYEVLSSFGRDITAVIGVEELLPTMARAAAGAVRATQSRVRLFHNGTERVVTWPPARADLTYDRILPVLHQGEQVGELAVAKEPGDPVTADQERLLEGIASQAGLAMHNARLAFELRRRLDEISIKAREIAASRHRLVNARALLLRRLERDIAHQVERQLEKVISGLERAAAEIERDPQRVVPLIDELKADAGVALDALREIARGQYPPLLADRGLGPAIDAQARKCALPVVTDIAPALAATRFEQPVEATVYFCCAEALSNAAKYAREGTVRLALSYDAGRIAFAVTDEGPGFDPEAVPDPVGLEHMRDRLEALGGELTIESSTAGTTVRGFVPAEPIAVPVG